MNIAILGGRFDPPHNGHLAIAREILRIFPSIFEVWLIPANTHPWKDMAAPAHDRLLMTEFLASRSVKVSDIDIKRGGETYTIDTVTELQKDISNQYFWIIGSDQIADFSRWKDSSILAHKIKFVVIPRVGSESVSLPENFIWAKGADVPDISSSLIRERIKNNQPISDLVPKEVESYITSKGLYK